MIPWLDYRHQQDNGAVCKMEKESKDIPERETDQRKQQNGPKFRDYFKMKTKQNKKLCTAATVKLANLHAAITHQTQCSPDTGNVNA